jgi:hypothetical protein
MGMADVDLGEIKNRVSAAVLKNVKGVSGVGRHEQSITIYLEEDTPEIRDAVIKAIKPLNLTVQLRWEVTGKFKR